MMVYVYGSLIGIFLFNACLLLITNPVSQTWISISALIILCVILGLVEALSCLPWEDKDEDK
jgi:hypothetical protein